MFGRLSSTSVVAAPGGVLPTDYRAASPQRSEGGTFTGQYAHVDDFGLLYYNARWYDPALGRFVQADTVVSGAGNPSAWDRYAYTQNNPLRYTDPSGHRICERANGQCKAPHQTYIHHRVQQPSDLHNRVGFDDKGHPAQEIVVPSSKYQPNKKIKTPHDNLCGHLSTAAIYETETGETYTLGWIWEAVPTAANEMSTLNDWVNFFNDLPGWQANYKYIDGTRPYEDVRQTVADSSYIMVNVNLNKGSGAIVKSSLEGENYAKHWIVIDIFDENGVTVYNPYLNNYQNYTWDVFTSSDGVSLVVQPPAAPLNIPEE